MKLNINHPAIHNAILALKYKVPSLETIKNPELLEDAFREEYNCKILSHDEYGIDGEVIFENDHALTIFLLKYGSK